jgi:hypothetical protein
LIFPALRVANIEYIIAPLTEYVSLNIQLEIVNVVAALRPLIKMAPPYARDETFSKIVSTIFTVTYVA